MWVSFSFLRSFKMELLRCFQSSKKPRLLAHLYLSSVERCLERTRWADLPWRCRAPSRRRYIAQDRLHASPNKHVHKPGNPVPCCLQCDGPNRIMWLLPHVEVHSQVKLVWNKPRAFENTKAQPQSQRLRSFELCQSLQPDLILQGKK